jgi:gliding motility-associated-like protein
VLSALKSIFFSCFFFSFISAQAQTFGELYYEKLPGLQDLRIHLKLARLCSLDSSGISFTRTVYLIDRQANKTIGAGLILDSSKQMRRTNDPCIVSPSGDCYTIFYLHTDIKNSFTGVFGFVTYLGCCRSFQNLSYLDNLEEFDNIAYSVKVPAPSQNIINSNAYFTTDTILHSCINKPFTYNQQAIDPDGDSLVYSLVKAIRYRVSKKNGVVTPIPEPPYTSYLYKSPFDTFPPLGSQVKINSKTGTISGVINETGNFLITVEADEYRNGTLISSHTKDIPIEVYDCSQLPNPNALLADSITDCNSFTQNFLNNSNSLSSYFLWDFGDGTSSTDISPQHTYKDTGTYIVKLISNKGYTCADSAFSRVLIYPVLNAKFTHEDSCSELPVTFYSNSSSTSGLINSYKWIFENADNTFDTINGSSVIQYNFSKGEKSYLVKLEVGNTKGCISTDSEYVNIYTTPSALPVHDTTIAYGYSYQIEPDLSGINGFSNYTWSPTIGLDNPFIANPVINYNQDITYHVSIKSQLNCVRKDSLHITYFKGPDVYVPSAFTPNNDGINDILHIKIVGMKSLDYFIIYNRFGQKVFEEHNENKSGWNGNIKNMPAPKGVYVWQVKATDVNNKPFIKKGTLILIR